MITNTSIPVATNIRIADVEKQLTALWGQLEAHEGESVLRASTMNMVIYTDTPEAAHKLPGHMPESHPGRLILVTSDSTITDTTLDVDATILCRPAFGRVQRQNVCGEQITLRAGRAGMVKALNAVQSLLIPDQPTYLIWYAPLDPDHPLLTGIGALSGGLIVDSALFTDADAGLATLQALHHDERLDAPLHDLNWERLLPLCEAIAEAFDPPEKRAALRTIQKIEIDHRHGRAESLLLVGWLADRLGWRLEHGKDADHWLANGTLSITFDVLGGGTKGFHSITFGITDGADLVVRYVEADHCIISTFGRAERARIAASLEPETLLEMIMSKAGADPLFERALAKAAALNGSLRNRTLIVAADEGALTAQAARRIVALAKESIAETGRFTIALSGGNTPKVVYQLLSEPRYRDSIEWSKVHIFWGDERDVPRDHAESNQRMARETLLSRVPIPEANIHAIKAGTLPPVEAAAAYAADIRLFFDLKSGNLPRFDLILLGMGDDGHTASLFPDTDGLNAPDSAIFIANRVPKLDTTRLTLTVGVINNAAHVLALIAGAKKATVLDAVLHGPPGVYPFQRVAPPGGLTIMVDEAASPNLR